MKKIFTIAIVMLAACSQANKEEEIKQIKAAWDEWGKKAMAGDPAYGFGEDLMYIVQGQPTALGKENFKKTFANMPKIPGMTFHWQGPYVIDIAKAGDMAYSLDTLVISMPDSLGKMQTSYSQGIHLWKKDDQHQWKVSLLMVYPMMPVSK